MRYALVDCNNFYVSCERVFDPRLVNRPVIVLSNNDGCVIARSQEVKKLGVTMGQPFFQLKDLIRRENIAVLSANFPLYADMSRRVMALISGFSDQIEVYSIDEAFIGIDMSVHADSWGHNLRNKIWQEVGIPVSVGIGPTKTLAKAGADLGKKTPRLDGIAVLTGDGGDDVLLAGLPVDDVWGVGRKYSQLLPRIGVYTALDLKKCLMSWAKRNMTICGERIVRELNGQVCYPLVMQGKVPRTIVTSRSFGSVVTQKEVLDQAIAEFVTMAVEKLRAKNCVGQTLSVFLIGKTVAGERLFQNLKGRLGIASAYTPNFLRLGQSLIKSAYKKGNTYKKAGVVITDIYPQAQRPLSLFDASDENLNLMRLIDRVNFDFGWGTLKFAPLGGVKLWHAKQSYKSPRYTTNWAELPVAKCA